MKAESRWGHCPTCGRGERFTRPAGSRGLWTCLACRHRSALALADADPTSRAGAARGGGNRQAAVSSTRSAGRARRSDQLRPSSPAKRAGGIRVAVRLSPEAERSLRSLPRPLTSGQAAAFKRALASEVAAAIVRRIERAAETQRLVRMFDAATRGRA